MPEAFAPAVFLPGGLGGEVQVLDRDRQVVPVGPVQEPGQRVADLCVAVCGRAGEVVGEAAGFADGVAVRVEAPGGKVVGVGVHPHHTPGNRRRQRHRLHRWEGPGGGHVPASARRLEGDAIRDSPVRGDAVGPLVAPVRESDRTAEGVTAVRGVRQMRQRGGQPDADVPARCDADGLVPEPLPTLPVRRQEPARRLPPRTPLLPGQSRLLQVVAVAGASLSAAYHPHPPRLVIGTLRVEPVPQDPQAA
ncbi:hypothetical protein SRB5_22090 [Streptomyces sp. RB5]|uniref:Uncharacterized protein n=1 Tax=Streptomyces smaragdinus TaxID=2585196 RepID=A0A7K0CF35_9ACTN|nr:hypothetical protein [Streptomyces smaragdinus]